jgi:hypothetical protein
LVLLSEHSVGVGPPGATLDVLVDLAAQNVGGSGILSQFQETYAGLVNAPVDTPGFVPTTQRCAHG